MSGVQVGSRSTDRGIDVGGMTMFSHYCEMTVAGLLVLLGAWGQQTAPADGLMEHLGHTEPFEEGWTGGASGPGTDMGPVDNPPVSAWFVDDSSSVSGSGAGFGYQVTPCQDERIDQAGWTLRGCIRAVDLDVNVSIFLAFNTGTRRFDMWFTSTEVTLSNGTWSGCSDVHGPSYPITDPTPTCHAAEFHLYELVYDPATQSADLFIDGVERLSDYTGHTILPPRYFVWVA